MITKDSIAAAVLATHADITGRRQAAPSPAVQLAAMTTIGHGQITVRRALSYDVLSETEPGRVHVVALYLRLTRDRSTETTWWTVVTTAPDLESIPRRRWRNEITGARCSCPNRAELYDPPATGGHPPCRHMLAALALARLDGYRLEVLS